MATEMAIGFYIGKAFALPGDVSMQRKGNRDIYHAVKWSDDSFKSPIYYSVRIIYWPTTDSRNGLALDFTHAKLYSDLQQEVNVTHIDSDGSRQTQQPLSARFSRLAFSHGYNLLTLNAVHRSPVKNHDALSDTSAYIGAGVGIAVPHVEIRTANMETDEYLPVGLVYQVMAGVTLGSERHVPVNAEYKFSVGTARATLSDNSRLTLRPQLHHFSIGPIYRAKR